MSTIFLCLFVFILLNLIGIGTCLKITTIEKKGLLKSVLSHRFNHVSL